MVNNRQQETLFTRYLTAKDEPLASKCIVDVISKIMAYYLKFSKPSMRDRSKGWLMNNEALSKKNVINEPNSDGISIRVFRLKRYKTGLKRSLLSANFG